MTIQVNDAIREACLARLKHAKKYNGLTESDNADKLHALISKAPGGDRLDIEKDGYCAHGVGAVDAELGYKPYGGRARDIRDFHVEISEPIPGCTVAFNAHAAFLDENLTDIFGFNQSDSTCSQPMRFYGDPLGFFVPREIAELATAAEGKRENVFGKVESDSTYLHPTPEVEDFAEAVAETKAELTSAAQAIDQHFKNIDAQLTMIDKRLANIEAYLAQFSAEIDEV